MKLVVADTGPLLHLSQISALHLLPLIGEVHISPTVLKELRRHAPTLWNDRIPDWLHLIRPTNAALQTAADWVAGGLLDPGEAEALAYAKEATPDLFVTDDAAARLMADSFSIPARGSLGIVLYCAALGKLTRNEAETHLAALFERSTLWVSQSVRTAATKALVQLFA